MAYRIGFVPPSVKLFPDAASTSKPPLCHASKRLRSSACVMQSGGDRIAAMPMNRVTRRLTAWIACFAILMASLAPSISHALAAAKTPGSYWMEICSSVGLQFIKMESGKTADSSSPAKHGLHFEDCPFCQTHANAIVLPPVSALLPLVVSGSFPLPPLFYQSPRPLFVWASPQSRAPPARS